MKERLPDIRRAVRAVVVECERAYGNASKNKNDAITDRLMKLPEVVALITSFTEPKHASAVEVDAFLAYATGTQEHPDTCRCGGKGYIELFDDGFPDGYVDCAGKIT